MERPRTRQKLAVAALFVLACSCSTTNVAQAPAPIPPPEKVPLLDLPHPEGYSPKDLEVLFQLPEAPPVPEACHATQSELVKRAMHDKEVRLGVNELVVEQPVLNHWCFYVRFLRLERELSEMEGILKKQRRVLDAYQDILPIARAFQTEFKDSRYLRWAIQTYRRLSPVIFFRKVELTPETTAELVLIEKPFSDWKAPASDRGPSVLEKYGLKSAPGRRPAAGVVAAPTPTPSAEATSAVPTVPQTAEIPLLEPESPTPPASGAPEAETTEDPDSLGEP